MRMKTLFLPLLLVWPLLLSAAEAAQDDQRFDEGIDYERVVPAQPGGSGGTVEVTELFWYGCPHCYAFEPELRAWLAEKPDYVEFTRVPAIFKSPRWKLHARAYYSAQALDVLDKVHPVIFHTIHEQNERLESVDALADLFASEGVSEEDFRGAMDSFAVQSGVSRAADLTRRYGIDGVPAMVVNGKYRVGASMAASHERLIDIVEFLVEKEHAKAAGR